MKFRRTLTLRRAIVLVVALGLLIPAALVGGYTWFRLYHDDVRKQTKQMLQETADIVAHGIQDSLWDINQESGLAFINALLARNEDLISIEVRDNSLGIFVRADYPERRVDPIATIEREIRHNGQTLGTLKIEAGNTRLRAQIVQGFRESMVQTLAQAVLSILLILLVLERRFVVPLEKLSAGAKRLANRQLDIPFTWQRLDEIGMLSRRMEDTRISLRQLFDELNRKNRELKEDIDKRKEVEEALSLSEAKFAGAFQCNPDSITISRVSDGMLIDINQTFTRITGYSREEVVGKSALELGIWIDPDRRKQLVRELRQNGIVRNFEWDMRTREGDIRQCVINSSVFTAGSEQYILSVITDVTDQKRLTAQKLEADRVLLRLAQGTRNVGGPDFFDLLVTDLASVLRTGCAFIGLRTPATPDTPETIHSVAAYANGGIIDNFRFAVPGTPSERLLQGETLVLTSDVQKHFPEDQWLVEYGCVSYAGAPLRNAAGQTIGVIAILDSSPLSNPELAKSLLQVFSERASAEMERKRHEEELRNSELRFSTIFQFSPIPMYVCMSSTYIIRDVNRAFENLFLLKREAIIGKTTVDLGLYKNPEDRLQLIEEMKRSGYSASAHDVWMSRGDGSEILAQLSGYSFTLGGEQFGIVACIDVTEKRRIEREIRELNANLEQRVQERTEELRHTLETLHKAQAELVRNEKLAALGSLVAGVAHELNTPIGNSLMVASTLADQTRNLAESYRTTGLKRSMLETYIGDASTASDILMRNLQRAANLVTSFKQVAVDQTSSQRRRFSLPEAVSEIMLTLWPTLKKTSFIVKQDIPDSLVMDSYPGPLGQVITNLVNNALLHGFEGRQSGTVTISAERLDDDRVALSVADDGIGIPAANLKRIFDPFFTTKLGAGGSGLGLNITHNIVTGVLGGRIDVESTPDVGTTFRLTLPLVAPLYRNEDEQAV